MRALHYSLFSPSRFTEPMIRGTANERPLIGVLKSKSFVQQLFESRMVSINDAQRGLM